MPSAFALIRSTSKKSQVRTYCFLAVVTAFFAALYWSAIETYTEPNALQLVGLEGKLNGYPEVWKHDSSLVSLGVRFKLAGDPEEKRLPVYAYKDAFEATGLRQGARVSLLVEYTPEQTIVREMHTLDGQVLFDDRMHQHVVAEGNNAAQRGLIFSLIVTALFVAGALEALWRQLRASSGSEADLQ